MDLRHTRRCPAAVHFGGPAPPRDSAAAAPLTKHVAGTELQRSRRAKGEKPPCRSSAYEDSSSR